jgi:hypothetical protein
VSGFEADRSANSGFVRFLPWLNADAPAVAGFEARKTEFGAGGNEVIADGFLVMEEFVIYEDADGVFANIIGSGVAFAVPIETCEGIGAAGLQDTT